MKVLHFLFLVCIIYCIKISTAQEVDPLFNPNSGFMWGPEIASVEQLAQTYNALHSNVIEDYNKLVSKPPSVLSEYTDISSLPIENGKPRTPKQKKVTHYTDKSQCNYEINHYCPNLYEANRWSELAECLHNMQYPTASSLEMYNHYMAQHHGEDFKPLRDLRRLPKLSKRCIQSIQRSPIIQCIHQVKAVCNGPPESPQHLLMCFEEHRSQMTGKCADIIDRFGGITDRGHTEFAGQVITDAANEKSKDTLYKQRKEHSWGYYFENHPVITYLLFILSTLLIVLIVYLFFGDIATIKRKCFGIHDPATISGKGKGYYDPETDEGYHDNFGDSDYNL